VTSGLAADHAVILAYHHVSNDTPASTSVSVSTFEKHLAYLQRYNFTVIPLELLLKRLSNDEEVPEKSIAITFDDAYISVYTTAMPLLRQYNMPFTVFVNTEPVEKGYSNFMNWEQLRSLQSNGGTVANHSHTHAYLIRRSKEEKDEQWRSRMRAEILTAQSRLSEKLGRVEKIFTYPYGEFTGPLQSIVTKLGFYGIGQHSGAVGYASDWSAVPRFPMATGFDSLDQFAIKVNSRPLPVEVLVPEHRLVEASVDMPIMRFKLGTGDFAADKLSCYFSGNKMAMNWLDRKQLLVEIKPLKAVGKGRIKYNCTAPATNKSGVYYWYSHLLIKR
jgi:peptidoglycan/xylan/chitin deacetylase (PgdA/CDA1 family)